MTVLRVVKFPDKILAAKTAKVREISDEDRKLVKDMIKTMYAERGVGLAANQVGISKQIFVASADQIRGREIVLFNPRIVKKEGSVREFEGCLSVPEYFEPVRRARRVWVHGTTPSGENVEIKADGLLARIFQHEIDHLQGLLFIDRLGWLKKRKLRKKLLAQAAASKL